MICNPSKCKELAFVKKGNAQIFERVAGIPQVKGLVLLGVTFQSDTPFNTHVKNKLTKANKSLHVLRTLRRWGTINQKLTTFSILLYYQISHTGLRCTEPLKLN